MQKTHLPQCLQFLQLLVVVVWILSIILQDELEGKNKSVGTLKMKNKSGSRHEINVMRSLTTEPRSTVSDMEENR